MKATCVTEVQGAVPCDSDGCVITLQSSVEGIHLCAKWK